MNADPTKIPRAPVGTLADSLDLRRALDEAIETASAGSPENAGWLSVDIASALLMEAHDRLNGRLPEDEAAELARLALAVHRFCART
ncbi:hypothetical protein [Jannaschia aquimarina]|nr:hypothetical protein [Jannaschia aquimarina]